jgi:hypothetical protein
LAGRIFRRTQGLLIRTFGIDQAEDNINIERQNMEVNDERDRSSLNQFRNN